MQGILGGLIAWVGITFGVVMNYRIWRKPRSEGGGLPGQLAMLIASVLAELCAICLVISSVYLHLTGRYGVAVNWSLVGLMTSVSAISFSFAYQEWYKKEHPSATAYVILGPKSGDAYSFAVYALVAVGLVFLYMAWMFRPA